MPIVESSTQLVLAFRSATALIDAIHAYEADGYRIDKLWYEYGWFWVVRYYARMTCQPPEPPAEPYIDFIIGPITNREIPKPPEPPRLEFIIGPITNRDFPKPPPLPHLEFLIGPIETKGG